MQRININYYTYLLFSQYFLVIFSLFCVCGNLCLTLVTSLCDQTLYIYALSANGTIFAFASATLPLQINNFLYLPVRFVYSFFGFFFFFVYLFVIIVWRLPFPQLCRTHNIHIYLESRVMLSLNSNARVQMMVSYMREYIDVHAILSRRPWHCLSLIQCSNVRLLFMVCSARRSIVTYIYIYIQHDIGGVLLQRSHKQRMKKKNKCKKHANTNVSFNLCFVLHVFCIFLSFSPHSFIHSLFESIYRVVLIAFAH